MHQYLLLCLSLSSLVRANTIPIEERYDSSNIDLSQELVIVYNDDISNHNQDNEADVQTKPTLIEDNYDGSNLDVNQQLINVYDNDGSNNILDVETDLVTWSNHSSCNCVNGKIPDGENWGIHTVEECQSLCLKNPICDAIVFTQNHLNKGYCGLRKLSYDMADCKPSPYWTTYLLSSKGKSSTFDELWNDSETQALINLVLSSDVVQKMESGTLDPRKFTTFLINDIYYISRGPSNYQLAINRTEDDEDELREVLKARYKSYNKYNKEAYEYWGIMSQYSHLFVNPIEKSEIENYTNFLQNVAENEKPYFTLVANAPCSYLWCWIGTYFQKIGCDEDKNIYCKTRKFFFGGKNSPKECSKSLVKAINKFGEDYDLEKQKTIFRQSVLYELKNFNSTGI